MGDEEDDRKMKRIEDIYASSSPQKKQKVEADSHEAGNSKKKTKTMKKGERKSKKISSSSTSTFGVVPPVFEPDRISHIQLHDVAQKSPSLLLKKKLDLDDVDRSLNRLLIGRCRPLLTQLLGEIKKKSDDDFVRFITRDVRGVDNELRLVSLNMNITEDAAEDEEYVLQHDWNDVVKILGLAEGDTIEGWGFPLGDEFRMTLVVFKKP